MFRPAVLLFFCSEEIQILFSFLIFCQRGSILHFFICYFSMFEKQYFSFLNFCRKDIILHPEDDHMKYDKYI